MQARRTHKFSMEEVSRRKEVSEFLDLNESKEFLYSKEADIKTKSPANGFGGVPYVCFVNLLLFEFDAC